MASCHAVNSLDEIVERRVNGLTRLFLFLENRFAKFITLAYDGLRLTQTIMQKNNYGIGEREIKFRVWDGQEMWDDSLGDWGLNGDICNPTAWKLDGGEDMNSVAMRETTLMQATGLKDKNGVDVYEGDIVRNGKATGIVLHKEYRLKDEQKHDRQKVHLGWCIKKEFGYLSLTYEAHGSDVVEVIGNIFENPNLTNLQDE